jgi:parallel beta-helix repeat protein
MKSPETGLVILEKWTDLHLPIASYDAVSGIAKLPGGPRPAWMDEGDSRYWLENFPAALDEPGEWYLEKSSGTLSLMPPSGTAPGTNVIAPRLTELVRFQGNGRNHENVYAVRLRGIRFSDCDYDMPLNGLISPQAAIGSHGAVVAEYTKDCSIEDCIFENIGGYAIELGVGCRGFQFRGNRIQDTGAGGIRIGDTFNLSPNSFDANYGNQILDNELVSLGRVFPSGVGILILQSANNRIAHNHIHDLYYTGISVGWTWGYNDTPCRENLIEFNLVERIGQGVLTDMGGIYTLGPQPGTVIRNNIFRDIVSHDYGGWGLYTDEGSTGILLENNVVYGCKSAGFHQHYGKENIVRNNIFAFNRDHQLMRTRAEAHRSFSFTKNVVVFNSGDLLGSDWTGSTNGFLMSGNLYWDTRVGTNTAAYSFAGAKFPAWQASGLDRDSIIADPLLVDPVRPELGLKQGSPAFALGFQAIDAASVGVRPRRKRDY